MLKIVFSAFHIFDYEKLENYLSDVSFYMKKKYIRIYM